MFVELCVCEIAVNDSDDDKPDPNDEGKKRQ